MATISSATATRRRRDQASLIASRLRLLRGTLARQAVERQIGHDARTRLRSGVDNRLV